MRYLILNLLVFVKYLTKYTLSVFVWDISDRKYLVCICVSIFVFLWDISDRMYLVWVVMHLLMGTICAGGRLSASSPLTPTNFTRSNCLDFLWFFWQLIIPRIFCISVFTNDPKTSVVSFSLHFSGHSWQIAVARPPCTHSLTPSLAQLDHVHLWSLFSYEQE